jgi:hypothetical protein
MPEFYFDRKQFYKHSKVQQEDTQQKVDAKEDKQQKAQELFFDRKQFSSASTEKHSKQLYTQQDGALYFKQEYFNKDKSNQIKQNTLERSQVQEEIYFDFGRSSNKDDSSLEGDADKETSVELPERFCGNSFTLDIPRGWLDKTLYTIEGFERDGLRHNILITVIEDVNARSVSEFARQQIDTLKEHLQGVLLLKEGNVLLRNGMGAYEAVVSWQSTNDKRLCQYQLYVLVKNTGYRLTATLSDQTHKTDGHMLRQILLSFNPQQM